MKLLAMPAEAATAAPPRSGMPSWLLSLILHLSTLIVLALAVRVPQSKGLPEPDRSGGIVLARDVSTEQTEYFDSSEGSPEAADPASETAASDLTNALPDTETLSDSPLVELPTATGSVPATNLLNDRLRLKSGGRVRLLPGHGAGEILADEAERRRARPALGSKARLSLFGSAAAEGRRFVFVVDRSKSMGGGGLDALRVATAEFERALATLEPHHKFQIVAYHHQRVLFGDERWNPATEENRQRVAPFMQGLAAFGGTNHEMAVASALYLKPDVVFLLTDGGDPPLTASQLERMRKLAAGRATIHCIQFGYGAAPHDENFMHRLAGQTGGSYRYVDVRQWAQ